MAAEFFVRGLLRGTWMVNRKSDGGLRLTVNFRMNWPFYHL